MVRALQVFGSPLWRAGRAAVQGLQPYALLEQIPFIYYASTSARRWIIAVPINSMAAKYSENLVLRHRSADFEPLGDRQERRGAESFYVYVRLGIRSLDLMKRVATGLPGPKFRGQGPCESQAKPVWRESLSGSPQPPPRRTPLFGEGHRGSQESCFVSARDNPIEAATRMRLEFQQQL